MSNSAPTSSTSREAIKDHSKDEVVEITASHQVEKNDDLALLERRKQHLETQKKLENEKIVCLHKLEELRQKRATLEDQKAVFQQQQQDYFQVTNAQKRLSDESEKTRGEKQRVLKGLLETEIATKRKQLEELQIEKDKYTASMERFKVYKDFLEVVEEKSEDAATIEEIMERFKTLTRTYLKIRGEIEEQRQQKETLAQTHSDHVQETETQIIQMNTEMERKQGYLKDLRLKIKQVENQLGSLDDDAAYQKELHAQLTLSIQNLYLQMHKGTTEIFKRTLTGVKPKAASKTKGLTVTSKGSPAKKGAGGQGESESLSKIPLEQLLRELHAKMADLQFIFENRYPQYSDISALPEHAQTGAIPLPVIPNSTQTL
ncbi:hypothetical protein BLNAU_13216 [Blattamonas nauphoetae]|uniref:DUF4200 domain-containing protein n=1 Tax=Blattamonas nauphoetae TaxID=2049346 RepID=A0ABQ9XHB9_9EUKA|nr:hypothetical protein BLNAU_13216 [Blattamonas nauphoetae]